MPHYLTTKDIDIGDTLATHFPDLNARHEVQTDYRRFTKTGTHDGALEAFTGKWGCHPDVVGLLIARADGDDETAEALASAEALGEPLEEEVAETRRPMVAGNRGIISINFSFGIIDGVELDEDDVIEMVRQGISQSLAAAGVQRVVNAKFNGDALVRDIEVA